MAETVVVNVSAALVPPSEVGFGVTLIPSVNAAWTGPLVRSYASEAEMATDFPVVTMPERVKARAFFSQSRRAPLIKFCRMATKPTTIYTLSAITPTSRPSYVYQVRVAGHGFAETLVTYTSDASPTDAEWAAGMVAALNGVAGRNYTAAGAASPITLTGNAAGAVFFIESLNPDVVSSAETTADAGIATDLAAAFLEDPDFYFVDLISGSKPIVVAAAAWVESNARMMLAGVSDSLCATGTVGVADDVADRIRTNGYKRTGVLWHRAPQSAHASAWVGDVGPDAPGSVNFAHKPLATVPAYRLSTTWESNLLAKNANIYSRNSEGRHVTQFGTAGDGSFLDETRAIDWLVYRIKRRTDALLTNNRIILYDQGGLNHIEAEIEGALGEGVSAGVVNASFPTTIGMPTLEDIPQGTRLSRVLPPTSVTFTPGGGVNKITINLGVL